MISTWVIISQTVGWDQASKIRTSELLGWLELGWYVSQVVGSDQASDPSGDLIHPHLILADRFNLSEDCNLPIIAYSSTTIFVGELKPNCGDKALRKQVFENCLAIMIVH